MIEHILMLIGALFCIVSALILITLALLFLRDFIVDTFYEYKLANIKNNFKHNTMQLALSHLRNLKKQYPELEITYNDEEVD